MHWSEAIRKSSYHIAIMTYEKDFMVKTFYLYWPTYREKPLCIVKANVGGYVLDEYVAEEGEWVGSDNWKSYPCIDNPPEIKYTLADELFEIR
jgi:hypothetical protein